MLQFFPTVEGYVDAANESSSGKPFEYVYNYTDHLGNIRVSYRADKTGGLSILQENDYYPFGMKHQKASSQKNFLFTKNNYKYNGKELQTDLDINLYDYGARNYDPAIGRWFNIDPLAEKSRRFSPYTYALNNPVYFIDPDGMMAEPPKDFNGGLWIDTSGIYMKYADNIDNSYVNIVGDTSQVYDTTTETYSQEVLNR